MNIDRDRSYSRRLGQVLVARLRAGTDPGALLDELKTRLDDAQAETMLSRAEARIAPAQPTDALTRVLAGVIYGWTAVLVLQQMVILLTVASLSPTYGLAPLLPRLIGFPVLKIGLLCAAVCAFKAWRSPLTAALYAAAVVFAFPFGQLLESSTSPVTIDRGGLLLSMSSLLSYATSALIGVVWWRTRRAAPPRVAPVFD